MQRVVRHILPHDRIPDLGFRPVGQRRNLHDVELVIPTNDRGGRTVRTLVTADAAHPRIETREDATDDGDLTVAAAAAGIDFVQRATMRPFVFLHRCFRPLERHIDAIPAGDAVAEFERLVELVAGVEIEDERFRGDGCQPVNDQTTLRAKRRGHRQSLSISLHSPRDDLRGLECFQGTAGVSQILEHLCRDADRPRFDGVQSHGDCPLTGKR